MTRWRGGFVAVGDLAGSVEMAHTKVWVSADGRTWDLLGADAFGPSAIVVGMAAAAGGLAALTLDSAQFACQGAEPVDVSAGDCWTLASPIRSWTSSDGTTWTTHPGPEISIPAGISGWVYSDSSSILQPATSDHLLVATLGSQLAFSRDGVTWETVDPHALPAGWGGSPVVGTPTGFMTLGEIATHTVELSSADGHVWTSRAFPTTCAADEAVVVGPAGLIVTGTLATRSNGTAPWTWCSSSHGRAWVSLSKYPPLGVMLDLRDQECRNNCPDGTLVGDGERMVAYRGWGEQAGWTSADGRSWRPLAFVGQPERSFGWLDDRCTNSLLLTSVGVLCQDSSGATWFGTPR